MVGIDDLLLAFASAAGKSAGEAIVKELINGVTSNLATKEDLNKAVEEIKEYIHQELTKIRYRELSVSVETAVRIIQHYDSSGLRIDLAEGNLLDRLSHAASEISSAIQLDPLFLWDQFITITRFVAVNSTFWSIKAFQFGEQQELINFARSLSEGAYLLRMCLNKIHEMEDESISDIKVDSRYTPDLTPDPSVTLRLDGEVISRAYFKLHRGRYNNGGKTVISQEINTTGDKNDDRVRGLIKVAYETEINRIQREAAARENIYKSIETAINAMNNILQRLQGPIDATYNSLANE